MEETITLGLKTETVKASDFSQVSVDTTVQEKAIRFPTDTQLCHTAREKLVAIVEAHGYRLRQNYRRKGKRALIQANRHFTVYAQMTDLQKTLINKFSHQDLAK